MNGDDIVGHYHDLLADILLSGGTIHAPCLPVDRGRPRYVVKSKVATAINNLTATTKQQPGSSHRTEEYHERSLHRATTGHPFAQLVVSLEGPEESSAAGWLMSLKPPAG